MNCSQASSKVAVAGQRDHVAHHHVRHRSLGRVQQHTADGQHALETILAIDDVEVDDPAPDLLLLDLRDSLAQGVVNQDLDEIRAGVVQRDSLSRFSGFVGGTCILRPIVRPAVIVSNFHIVSRGRGPDHPQGPPPLTWADGINV